MNLRPGIVIEPMQSTAASAARGRLQNQLRVPFRVDGKGRRTGREGGWVQGW